jgi:Fic-DOC domain mobile mystery protein B
MEQRMCAWPTIPGETPIDVSGLKVRGIGTRAELSVHEAENVRKAVLKYLSKRPNRRSAPFDLRWFKRLHKEMFGDVWKWAGSTRHENVNMGVEWYNVDSQLENLVDDLASWEKSGLSPLECSARLHYRAVLIHPFPNGNGRWARMLANIWLLLHHHSVIDWPDPAMGNPGPIRNEYLNALKAADGGDFQPLIELHQRFTSVPARPVMSQPRDSDSPSRYGVTQPAWTSGPPPDSAPTSGPVVAQQTGAIHEEIQPASKSGPRLDSESRGASEDEEGGPDAAQGVTKSLDAGESQTE